MKTKEELIFQALGAASMCWSGTPSGIFDSTRCKQIGDELIAALETVEAIKPSHNKQSTPCQHKFIVYADCVICVKCRAKYATE